MPDPRTWLFLHRSFPAQYLHVSRSLVAAGDRVVAVSQGAPGPPGGRMRNGVLHLTYAPPPEGPAVHPHLWSVDQAVRNGLAVAGVAERLRARGILPDLVAGHTGWGETLFIKDVWPTAPVLGYFEFYYAAAGADVGFEAEFPPPADVAMRLRTRNAVSLMAFESSDWGQTPTRWQRDRYPARFRERLSVLHEGVDTERVRPDPGAVLRLDDGRAFASGEPVVTYVARGLEPYRGFHVFMRALPRVLREAPGAQVLIVGDDRVRYGAGPARAETWRAQMLAELGGGIDPARVHFLGRLPYEQYLKVLQVSAVHVYLTYPFVLSWSLLEAMAAGCRIVASATPPVEEVIEDGREAHLVAFGNPEALAARIAEALRDPSRGADMRTAARNTARRRFDLRRVCLPAHRRLLRSLCARAAPRTGASLDSDPSAVQTNRTANIDCSSW